MSIFGGRRRSSDARGLENDRLRLEDYASLIFDVVDDVLFLIQVAPDGEFRFAAVNRSFLNATGLTESQVVGKTIDEVIPASSLELVRGNYLKVIALAEPVEWEETSVYSGQEKVGEVTATPVFDIDGVCTHLVGCVHDITNRRLLMRQAGEAAAALNAALVSTVQALSLTTELSDPFMAGHQDRVADLAKSIAAEMGYPNDRIDGLYFGALIHDLGRAVIPNEILNRSGKLSEVEFSMVKEHPQAGSNIIRAIDFPWPIADMVVQHHERLNGSGYPDGLRGDEITEEAQIIAVADVVEAMCSHRPYRPALGIDAALEEITTHQGILFDPSVVDACVHLFVDKGYSLGDPSPSFGPTPREPADPLI